MSDDGSSWAPFGPSLGDDDESPAAPPPIAPEPPAPIAEPPADHEPGALEGAEAAEEPLAPVSEPPPLSFAPPAAPPVQPLPRSAEPAAQAWPTPDGSPPEPQGQQAPWPPQGFAQSKPVPSDATVALVLGIASILFCGLVGPFAVHYGAKARRQIDADPALGGRGLATWGFALGIVSTAVLVLLLLLIAVGAFSVT